MEKKLEDLTDTELKAFAYDLLAQLQLTQRNLEAVNSVLGKRAQEARPERNDGVIPRLGDVDTV